VSVMGVQIVITGVRNQHPEAHLNGLFNPLRVLLERSAIVGTLVLACGVGMQWAEPNAQVQSSNRVVSADRVSEAFTFASIFQPLAAETDRGYWTGPLPGPLPFHYGIHTFRGDAEGTAVVAAIAVPVSGLRRERKDGQFRYRFDVRFVLADTVAHSVVNAVDSVFVSLPEPLARRHLLSTVVELRAPPSSSTLQRVVVTDATRPGVGQLYDSPFPIPDYSGTQLMISDIAFGLPDVVGGWARGGVTLALIPTSQFPESEFDVYYEIYNLPANTPYETEISVQPVGEDEREHRVVRTVFTGESRADDDDTLVELRRVESALEEGGYRLTVTVRDMTNGQTAARSRIVQVRGWGRGATLVPALPKRDRSVTSGSQGIGAG
jgi:hypothetical protein